ILEFNKNNVKINIKKENFLDENFGSEKYDLVIAMHVLQHIDNISCALEKINMLSEPNGTIFITTYDNTLDDWLNTTHYQLLTDLKFPLRMLNRSEEHTSELQSRFDLVCRLLLEKKKSII